MSQNTSAQTEKIILSHSASSINKEQWVFSSLFNYTHSHLLYTVDKYEMSTTGWQAIILLLQIMMDKEEDECVQIVYQPNGLLSNRHFLCSLLYCM